MQPDAFEIVDFGSLRNHVCFENQEIIFNYYPCSSLFDTSQATLAKTIRIDFQRIDSAFQISKLGLDGHDELQLINRRRPEIINFFTGGDGPAQLKQPLAT